MLEKMNDFFTARVDGYDEHMKSNIEGASDFYRYTAEMLPNDAGAKVLDLGCGTGLELEEFFKANPNASVTGIDLTKAMLDELKDVKNLSYDLQVNYQKFFELCNSFISISGAILEFLFLFFKFKLNTEVFIFLIPKLFSR